MATALAAVGALVMSGGLVMLGAATANAEGNNGTVKIDGVEFDVGEENGTEPFVGCVFRIQWYNFTADDAGDDGKIPATVHFELKPPTDASFSTNPDDSVLFTPTATANDMDYEKSYQLPIVGQPVKGPDDKHGYKVKVTVNTDVSQGNNVKHKVFWTAPCTTVEDTLVTPSVVWDDPDCFDASAGWTGKVNGVNDVAGTGDGVAFAVTSGTVGPSQAVTVTATAASGYAFDAQGLKTMAFQHTFGAVPTVQQCSTVVDTLVTPSVVWDDPDCFDASAGWTGRVNGVNDVAGIGDGVAFAVTSGTVGPSQAVTVTATAASGYAFDAQGLKTMAFQHTFGAVPTAEQCGIAGVEEVAPEITFTDPDCDNLDGADWSGNLKEIVAYEVTGTPGLGESVTVTASIKPAVAEQYAFPEDFDATVDHTYPTLAELDCVLGEETVVPSPKPEQNPPVVLGTEAAVPTQVHAGMASLPSTGTSANALLAQLMVGAGLILLVAGGWVGFTGRDYGKHHI